MTSPGLPLRPFPEGAFDPPVVAAVAEALAEHWDPDGRMLRAARAGDASRTAPRPDDYAEWAAAVCGIVAAGGGHADVAGYLRREEEARFGAARSDGRQRWQVALAAWRATGRDMRDEPRDPPAGARP